MADGVAGAIIELTVKGGDMASREADRVRTDLTSTERAGHSAEGASKKAEHAANNAERATEKLQRSATRALGLLSRAGRLGNHLMGAGSLLGTLGEGATVTQHAFHLLEGILENVVPGGGLIAGGLSLAAGAFVANNESDDSKDEKQARRIAEHLQKNSQDNLDEEMLRQVGLTKLDRLTAGGGGRVQ